MLTISGNDLGTVFENLAADERLDGRERAAAARIAGWFADYDRHDGACLRATEEGNRAAWEEHARECDRLMGSRPFFGPPKSTAEMFSLIVGDVRFTVRQYTTGAVMNVGVDRVDRGRAENITHYQAHIYDPHHHFDERAPLTDEAALYLANHGTTPGRITPELQARADRLKAALLAGKVVRTTSAEISPLTTADFAAGRLTPVTGSEQV